MFFLCLLRPLVKRLVRCVLLAGILFFVGGQKTEAQSVGLKTNTFYLATTTPNIGIEFKLADQWTMSVVGGYNPIHFPSWHDEEGNTYNPKLKHWLVMPEAKFWPCKAFERSSIGLHAIYGQFNVGTLRILPALERHRYTGFAVGGGFSYGYHLPMGRKWGVEFSLGLGYLYLRYQKGDAAVCANNVADYDRHYFGPTKLAISFIYFIN